MAPQHDSVSQVPHADRLFLEAYYPEQPILDIDHLTDRIIGMIQQLENMPQHHDRKMYYLGRLATFLSYKSRALLGDAADLDDIVHFAREAVIITPEDHPNRAQRLNNLGAALAECYRRKRSIEDLYEAIMVIQEAVLRAQVEIDKVTNLHDLGVLLGQKYCITRDTNDSDKAIAALQDAVRTMANPAEKVITICLMSLSNQHAIRYYDEGRMVHLESSIDLLFQVAVLVPGINTDPHYLFHIAFRMGAEFQLTGAMTALDTSILMAQRAVELAPPNAPDRALYCHTLGRALGTRGIKANIPSDIDDAITASREAVNRTAEGHIDRKTYIYGLEAWLGDRYSRCGDMADLQEIIKLGIEIVSSMSDEDPHKALRANNLGFRIQQRYAMQVAEAERRQQRHLVPLDDLDGAIKCYYYAAVHTPEDNVLRRAYGSNVLNAVRQYCQGMDSILDHQNNNRRPSEPPTTEDTSQTLTPASGTTAVAPDADELGLGRGVLSSSLEEPRTDGHPFNTPVSSDGAPELSEQPSVLETT